MADQNEQDKKGGNLITVDFKTRRREVSSFMDPCGIDKEDLAIDDQPEVRHEVSYGCNETKLAVFKVLISKGLVLIRFDTSHPGVIIPRKIIEANGDKYFTVSFSYKYGLNDFVFDERIVSATLSFSGEKVFCRIPWQSVVMIMSQAVKEVCLFPEWTG